MELESQKILSFMFAGWKRTAEIVRRFRSSKVKGPIHTAKTLLEGPLEVPAGSYLGREGDEANGTLVSNYALVAKLLNAMLGSHMK